ncbi:NUDIX domain-containing protein [Microbispora catharanthi]|uniref:NUDIX domain-containing protein n=2 Tax=Microbispora catharanthi TaxID=1712871 RepID=A0A5N6BUW6_9ACTN|nr:NUDIX domain-containing protein [Microbispora catharanthi]
MAADEAGNELTAFHRVAEQAVFSDAPTPLALVAAWHRLAHLDRLLLVFNRYRQCWELPGGLIDPGETPRQAAVRELREESGLRAEDLTFAGYARFVLGAERRMEYAAVYALRVPGPHGGFVPNAEIAAIGWWDGTTPLPGRVQHLDVLLGRLARETISDCGWAK